VIELTVSADAAGQRLDKSVRRALSGVPLSHVYKMFRTRKIRVNGRRGRAEQLLADGDRLALRGAAGRPAGLAGGHLPSGGLHRRDRLVDGLGDQPLRR